MLETEGKGSWQALVSPWRPAPRFSLAVVNKAVNLTEGFPYIR